MKRLFYFIVELLALPPRKLFQRLSDSDCPSCPPALWSSLGLRGRGCGLGRGSGRARGRGRGLGPGRGSTVPVTEMRRLTVAEQLAAPGVLSCYSGLGIYHGSEILRFNLLKMVDRILTVPFVFFGRDRLNT